MSSWKESAKTHFTYDPLQLAEKEVHCFLCISEIKNTVPPAEKASTGSSVWGKKKHFQFSINHIQTHIYVCASNTCKHVYFLEGQISRKMWVKTKWDKEGYVSSWPPLLQMLQQSSPQALKRCLVQSVTTSQPDVTGKRCKCVTTLLAQVVGSKAKCWGHLLFLSGAAAHCTHWGKFYGCSQTQLRGFHPPHLWQAPAEDGVGRM